MTAARISRLRRSSLSMPRPGHRTSPDRRGRRPAAQTAPPAPAMSPARAAAAHTAASAAASAPGSREVTMRPASRRGDDIVQQKGTVGADHRHALRQRFHRHRRAAFIMRGDQQRIGIRQIGFDFRHMARQRHPLSKTQPRNPPLQGRRARRHRPAWSDAPVLHRRDDLQAPGRGSFCGSSRPIQRMRAPAITRAACAPCGLR